MGVYSPEHCGIWHQFAFKMLLEGYNERRNPRGFLWEGDTEQSLHLWGRRKGASSALAHRDSRRFHPWAALVLLALVKPQITGS